MTIQVGDASSNAVFTDVLSQASSLGSLNAQSLVQLRGQATVVIQVTAIGSLTLAFEATVDGTNFFAVNMFPVAGGAAVTTTTANGQWTAVIAGYYQFRTRVSAFTSGTVLVSSNAAQGTNEQRVAIVGASGGIFDAVSGAAVPANGVLVAGGSIAGGTNLTPLTVKAASTAAAATDTSLVVQPLVGNAVMSTAAAGVQKVGVVGNANAAFDGAIAAAPPANAIQIGYKAATANPTNATAGNAVAPLATLAGSLVTTPLANRTLIKHQATATSASTETTIITAGGAGVFNDLLTLIVTTASAAAAGTLTIRDVTAAGTPFIINYPNAALAPGAPLVLSFPVPLTQGTANSAWTITDSQAVAINVTAQYVQRLA